MMVEIGRNELAGYKREKIRAAYEATGENPERLSVPSRTGPLRAP